MTKQILYYIHDPMCSWCWGFRPVWKKLQNQLAAHPQACRIGVRYLLGGLAADTTAPMPQAQQQIIQDTWRHIQQSIPGTQFNYDFWTACRPRRSTYGACRAVIAAGLQDDSAKLAVDMLYAIQQAYYLHARNPSDDTTLINLAEKLSLDTDRFISDLNSVAVQTQLEAEIQLCRELGVYSFPSLVLHSAVQSRVINIDYNQPDTMLRQIIDAT